MIFEKKKIGGRCAAGEWEWEEDDADADAGAAKAANSCVCVGLARKPLLTNANISRGRTERAGDF